MTAAMSDAIKAAKVPVDGVRDWYDGMTFREAVAAGLFHSDACVALSISVDGFEDWRQWGFQGGPIVVTVLSVQPGERVKSIPHIILAVTPEPRRPVDLESFLHPISEELHTLAQGIRDVKITGRDRTSVLQAFVIKFTSDMPGGDNVLNAKGCGSIHPGRFKDFVGFRIKRQYCYPPVQPAHKKRMLFSVQGPVACERAAASLTSAAEEVEAARRAGSS